MLYLSFFSLGCFWIKKISSAIKPIRFSKSLWFCVFKRFQVVILRMTLIEDKRQIHIAFNVFQSFPECVMDSIDKAIGVMFRQHHRIRGLFWSRPTLRWTNPDVGQRVQQCGQQQGLCEFLPCAEQSLDSSRTDQWEPWQMTPRHGLEGVRKLCGLGISLPLWWWNIREIVSHRGTEGRQNGLDHETLRESSKCSTWKLPQLTPWFRFGVFSSTFCYQFSKLSCVCECVTFKRLLLGRWQSFCLMSLQRSPVTFHFGSQLTLTHSCDYQTWPLAL